MSFTIAGDVFCFWIKHASTSASWIRKKTSRNITPAGSSHILGNDSFGFSPRISPLNVKRYIGNSWGIPLLQGTNLGGGFKYFLF